MQTRPRIVIVNDYPEFLELMEELLSEEGYEVVTLPKHQGAFGQIKDLKPTLIICDLMFENLPAGWALIDMLYLDPSTQTIPIIVCSAATRFIQEVMPTLDAKGIFWIEKPFSLASLLDKIATALQRNKIDS